MKIIKKVMYVFFVMILTLIVANSKVFGSNAVSSLEEKEGVVVLGTYKKIENVTVQKEVQITEEMKLAAAEALAALVSDEELCDDFIMPEAFDPRVAEVVSQAVKSHIS